MSIGALLLAFFLWPGSSDGVRPVELAGEDMRADWQAHAADATVVATPIVPSYNILVGWRKLGVKVLKRVEYDKQESAEHFRRNIGALALHEGADGVWLVGREAYPESWQAAYREAEKDVAAIGRAKALAEKAMGMRDTAHDAWIAGRHVLWALTFFDFEMENLDTIRFEFESYSRYLEQLLAVAGKKQQAYNNKKGRGTTARDEKRQQAYDNKNGQQAYDNKIFEVSKGVGSDRETFTPFEGKSVVTKQVALLAKSDELAPGLAFRHDNDVGFTITSKETCENGKWPGGGFTLWLYLPGKDGTWLPYEWRIDLSAVEGGRAPSDGYGLWFGVERWGKGVLSRYADPKTWRLRPVFRGSASPEYPHIWPSFRMEWPKEGGWRVSVGFSWLDIYHQWPALVAGPRERWYVGVEWGMKTTSVRQQDLGSVQQEGVYCRIEWPAGRVGNWKTLAGTLSYEQISRRYEENLEKSKGLYELWYGERLYDFAKVPVATWHRGDTESDKIFCERVVVPMVDANETVWKLVYSDTNPKDGKPVHRPKIEGAPEAVQMKAWQNLGKLLDLPYRVSLARRDYLVGRAAGKVPDEPAPKPPKEGAEAVTEPDVDNDDNPLKLDEEAF